MASVTPGGKVSLSSPVVLGAPPKEYIRIAVARRVAGRTAERAGFSRPRRASIRSRFS